jgi:exonuclease SbcD
MTTKKAIAVFSTDWHLRLDNISVVKELITQKCELAKRLGVKALVCLGDVFDSRKAQPEDVLTAFSDILDIIDDYGMHMYCIPGNHDKTDYSSKSSFLTPYTTHPALSLICDYDFVFISDNVSLYLMPFFVESEWIKRYEEFLEDALPFREGDTAILCTHIAVTGSRNNDGTCVESALSAKMFQSFDRVLSGHYHDQQRIGENFYHIPSIRQANFGEDDQKGFTILYEDGSTELHRSQFKKYVKVKVDLDLINGDELDALRRRYAGDDDNIRFEVTGREELIKSLHREDFSSIGIDLKTVVREIQNDIEYSEHQEIHEHTKESIREEFQSYCEREKYSLDEGLKYLNKVLK